MDGTVLIVGRVSKGEIQLGALFSFARSNITPGEEKLIQIQVKRISIRQGVEVNSLPAIWGGEIEFSVSGINLIKEGDIIYSDTPDCK